MVDDLLPTSAELRFWHRREPPSRPARLGLCGHRTGVVDALGGTCLAAIRRGRAVDVTRWRQLGALEHGVMSHLWNADESQTVRQVHRALCAQRPLAYTTVMTVLRRLSAKELVVQIRDERAFRYAATRTRGELIAALMFDALDQIDDQGVKHTALEHFVGAVGPNEVRALAKALGPVAPANAPETSATQPTNRGGPTVRPHRDPAPDAAVAVCMAPTGSACRPA